MRKFGGFQDSETLTAIPDAFFREVLKFIKDAAEIKVVLNAMWLTEHMDGQLHALTLVDFEAASLGLRPEAISAGLEKAVQHGILLRSGQGTHTRYYLNSSRGRAAAAALHGGIESSGAGPSFQPMERPNLFKLYEENIGPLTPLIADALKDAEASYPSEWIVEAIELATKNNKRSWSYCHAILKRWKEEGRGKKQNRRDDQAARQRDVEQKIRKFIDG